MILVDSSVWISHFRGKEPRLASLLNDEQVVTHPCVIGELALGSLKNRSQVLGDLQMIGWIDAHLLLSCILNSTELWTADKTLLSVARFCGAKLYS
ncbi:MAG: hypothetical protein AUI45_14695 [Acidobacteria bacterium 13_1_40CM_2_56_11]|nr:MAG: hypothetical protein AUI45_14695 [Acidobacteria bacterium 13_1_40CM_2_56_11]